MINDKRGLSRINQLGSMPPDSLATTPKAQGTVSNINAVKKKCQNTCS